MASFLRWLALIPAAFAIALAGLYVGFGINWIIDHTIALIPLGGIQEVLAIPFRLGLAGGAAAGGVWWGEMAAIFIAPQAPRVAGFVVAILLLAFNILRAYDLFSRGGVIDIIAVIALYGFPIISSLIMLFYAFAADKIREAA